MLTLHRWFTLAESSLAKIGYSDKNIFLSTTTSTSAYKGSDIGQRELTLPQQQGFQLSHMLATAFLLNQSQTGTGARGWQMVAVEREKTFVTHCHRMLPCCRRNAPTASSMLSLSRYLVTTAENERSNWRMQLTLSSSFFLNKH